MFDFCLVIETETQLSTQWLSARNMVEANEKVGKALLNFAIETGNIPIRDTRIIFSRSDFIRAARR